MKTVSQILHAKGPADVHVIGPGETVLEAIRRMAEKGIGALVVQEGEIMTPTGPYVRPQQSNEDCMALMANSRVRHLPVLEHGRLVGLISMGDLVKDIISDQQFTIEQLEHYINGQRA